MAERESPPPKKDVARALLLRGSLFVYLDPRKGGVQVPPWLARQPQLVLQVGLDLPVPIPDLRVDDSGVFGTLSFNRAPFTCSVPWTTVFALVGEDGMGMVWPEDIPPEVAAEVEQSRRQSSARGASANKAGPLRAIDGGASDKPSSRPAYVTHGAPPSAMMAGRIGDAQDTGDRSSGEVANTSELRPADDADALENSTELDADATAEPAADSTVDGRRKLPPYLRVIK